MTINLNSDQDIAQRVADFLQRHNMPENDGLDITDTIVQPDLEPEFGKFSSQAEPAPHDESPTIPHPLGTKKSEPADAMREMRSVASAISISISRSNLLREKLKEATRFLTLGFTAALVALLLAWGTTTTASLLFFSSLLSLVLGLICTYRSTMIMNKLGRIAKI